MTPKLTRKTLLWALTTCAVVALAWLSQREPVQLVSVVSASRGPLVVSFVEDGKTRLQERYLVTAPVAGVLRRITLAPGDSVRAGQAVAAIDPASSTLLDARARSQALADVSTAGSAANAAQQRISAARSASEVAARQYQRLQTLQAEGMVPRAQLDAASAQAELASAELAAALADAQIAQRRLQTAQAVLTVEGRAGTGPGARTVDVSAPVDGVVLKRLLDSAAPVAMGQSLLEIGNPKALEIEVEALSTDAVRLQPGLPARVLRWGGEGVLEARVSRIEPGGFTKVSALGVEEQRTRVILAFSSPHAHWAALGDAFRVEVEFILRQESAVLQVPASALFRIADGWAVYRVEGRVARRTPVGVGLRSATAVQITQGLEAGQAVIVQPDDRIRNGVRVKPVAQP